MSYTPPSSDNANLIFSGVFSSPSGDEANLIFGADEEIIRTVLYQIWADDKYVYCATAKGLGIIPL